MPNNEIQKAVKILRQGGLIAMPTETVYGLAADAKNPDAITKIFSAKGRPIDHPLIVHIADIAQLSEWAVDVSEHARELARQFWPGPLTLILKKAPLVSDLVTGGQDTIGIRIPHHPVALSLLRAFGSGLAAPSANRFGSISPTTAEAVREELGDRVDLILEGGQCEVGVESTIVDVSADECRILRPGMISQAQIEEVLHQSLSDKKKNAPRVSGSMLSHYAPRTPLHIVLKSELSELLVNYKFPMALLVRGKSETMSLTIPLNIHYVVMPENPEEYAHDLYSTLRMLDKNNYHALMVEALPDDPSWDAVRDRLQRAAH